MIASGRPPGLTDSAAGAAHGWNVAVQIAKRDSGRDLGTTIDSTAAETSLRKSAARADASTMTAMAPTILHRRLAVDNDLCHHRSCAGVLRRFFPTSPAPN